MDYLNWDLAILAKSVAFPNLTAAAAHVGLSQPQLSRIIAKLEERYRLTLLDRESRRRSAWTKSAHDLADLYNRMFHSFTDEVQTLVGDRVPRELHVGTLEGLTERAQKFCHAVLEATRVVVVHLAVLDLSQLEEDFAKGVLDVVFTARAPAAATPPFARALGYQSVDARESGAFKVYSPYEYARMASKGPATEKAFVSNSLRVRLDWIETYGGTATVPSPVRAEKSNGPSEVVVLALGTETLGKAFWDELAPLA